MRRYTAIFLLSGLFWVTFAAAEDSPAQRFDRAAGLFKLERYRDALVLLQEIEKEEGPTDRTTLLQGIARYKLKDYARAAALFDKLLSGGSERSVEEQALLYKGLLDKAAGNTTEAVAALKRAAALNPAEASYPLAVLASLFRELGDDKAAFDLFGLYPFESLVPPWRGRYLLDMTETLYRRGRRSDAAALLGRAAALGEGEDFEVLLRLSELDLALGAAGRAEARAAVLSRGVIPAAAEARLVYVRAFALYRLGRTGDALAMIGPFLERKAAAAPSPEILVLRARLLLASDRRREALAAYEDYLAVVPSDASAALDAASLYLDTNNYSSAALRAGAVLSSAAGPGEEKALLRAKAGYLLGLTRLNQRNYSAALTAFDELVRERPPAGTETFLPYAVFYSGWCRYRIGQYPEAFELFSRSMKDPSLGETASQARYYAAWCSYSLGRHQDAAGLLKPLRTSADRRLAASSRLLLAQALRETGAANAAGEEFRLLFTEYPESAQADDARFEYAGMFVREGNALRAAEEYGALAKDFPASTLREEALYKRGEVLYSAKRWKEAGAAFYDYRASFPRGKFQDGALYWGGLAYYESGERHGALLLWERLLSSFPGSPFRADVLRRCAEIHAAAGEYSRAAERYDELVLNYPADAEAFGAAKRLDELKLLREGFSSREAALTVKLKQAGGPASAEGRAVLLELARFHVYEGQDPEGKARPLLEELLKKERDDPKTAAEARFLRAEIERKKQNFPKAAELYLETASAAAAGPDLVARSLLRAAESMKLAGRREEVERLVDLLKKNYPSSDWASEGERLLEGPR